MRTVFLPQPDRVIVHPIKANCGYNVADWLLGFEGLPLIRPVPKSETESVRGGPIYPDGMVALLQESGRDAEAVKVHPHPAAQLAFIEDQLCYKKRPFAIMIRTKLFIPHWIGVGGIDGKAKLAAIYDRRYGTTSFEENVPIGNRLIPLPQLYREWFGAWLPFIPRFEVFRNRLTGGFPPMSDLRYIAVIFK